MNREKSNINQIMKMIAQDFEIEGIIISEEDQQLVKRRILGEISEEEFKRIVLDKSIE